MLHKPGDSTPAPPESGHPAVAAPLPLRRRRRRRAVVCRPRWRQSGGANCQDAGRTRAKCRRLSRRAPSACVAPGGKCRRKNQKCRRHSRRFLRMDPPIPLPMLPACCFFPAPHPNSTDAPSVPERQRLVEGDGWLVYENSDRANAGPRPESALSPPSMAVGLQPPSAGICRAARERRATTKVRHTLHIVVPAITCTAACARASQTLPHNTFPL